MEESTLSPETRKELDRQMQVILRGVVELLPRDEFKAKLANSIETNQPLRVKQGFDPTAPDIHLGHTIGIRKLRQLQDLGHQIVLIIGDYTGMVGDPSERSATRPSLSYDQIMKNAETYQTQFFKILDKSRTEIRFNGEWFKKMNFLEIMNLATRFTVARLLERDDFSKRMKAGVPISLHELFYPLMQGYDSVAIKADLEIGATEQTFNLLAGRTIQEAYGVIPQCVLTLPILVGLDGVKRMSKSLGNYIGIDEPAREIFGKVMSIPDNLIYQYYELVTDVSPEELQEVKKKLSDSEINPMSVKKDLGITLVDMYHPEGSGVQARSEFERMFSRKGLPDDMPVVGLVQLSEFGLDIKSIYLVHLISKAKLAKSNTEARKLIEAGGVSLNDEKVTDSNFEFELTDEMILKVGKRRFLKLIPH